MKTENAVIALASVSLFLSAAAIGVAGMSFMASRDAVTQADVQNAINAQPVQAPETEPEFRARVESAIEAIVEARRASSGNNNRAAAPGPSIDSTGMLSMNEDGQVVYGNPTAEITIYTFADFRCSFCDRYVPIVEQYVHDSNGAVNWISKPFPVLGPASDKLAQAAECVAKEEGAEAYWRYSKLAYSTQNWSMSLAGAGLADLEDVNKCVQENRYGSIIDQSLSEGHDLNITGTPASLVRNNGTEKGVIAAGYMEADQIHQLVAQVLQ